MKIFHTIPFKAHPCHDGNACTSSIIVDSRWTIPKLRQVLTDVLNEAKSSLPETSEVCINNSHSSCGNKLSDYPVIKVNQVRMFLHMIDGKEVRQDVDLRNENIFENSKIFLAFGNVPPPDHYVLKFNIYIPKCHDGVTRREQYIHSLSTNSTLMMAPSSTHVDTSTHSRDFLSSDESEALNAANVNGISSDNVNLNIQDEFSEKLNTYKLRNSGYEGSDSDETDAWNDGGRRVTKSKNVDDVGKSEGTFCTNSSDLIS